MKRTWIPHRCAYTLRVRLMEAISWKVTYTQVDEKTFEVPKDDTV